MPKRKKQTPLQAYLREPLPPFRRGSADCCAWAAGWVNRLLGEEVLKLAPITFGEARRRLKTRGLAARTGEFLEPLGFRKVERPADGDIIVYPCPDALEGQAVGIYSEGAAVSRTEGDSLHITRNPETIAAWSLTSS